jgi:hypothetical protein
VYRAGLDIQWAISVIGLLVVLKCRVYEEGVSRDVIPKSRSSGEVRHAVEVAMGMNHDMRSFSWFP